MSTGLPHNYVDDPQRYCNLVTDLIEKGDSEWQSTWKSGIIELFEGSDYSINSVNALLKVIEKAFKERKYHIRAQAFECWQFFINRVEKQPLSTKLLNVILIPLSASNHSVKQVLVAKLKAWLTLLQTNTLCKSISREKGIPSLLKILYGPHTLEVASSHSDLLELCGTIYSLMVQKCLENDENNVILSYFAKVIPTLNVDHTTRRLGKEIWIDAIEYISTKRWPMTLFNYLLKTLENLLSTNCDQDRIFMHELLPVLICDYNSYPVDHLISQLSLLTRCLFYSASSEVNSSSTLEYLMKKFRKKEQILFDELNKTLTECLEDFKEHLQKCWISVVSCFCKWNKNEIDSDNYVWILLFPVKYLHEKWNSIIQDCVQMCFENIYSVSKVDTFVRNTTRKLNTFLNNSENVPLSLLSAATCLCKIVLQKSNPIDDVSAIRDSLITIYEKLPSQTTLEGPQVTLICKYLSCLLYFTKRYPEYDHEFGPIIRKYSLCIDLDKESKEYPVVQLLSKYTNKTKEEEKLSNVLNIITTPNKGLSQSFLARLSPAGNKLPNGSPFGLRSVSATNASNFQNGDTPKTQRSKSKDDDVQFVTIKSTPKNSPMTEHQREMAKEKSYIPAMYEDLSQSQSHSDSQSMLPSEKTPVAVKVPSIDIIEENAILPSNDTNGDSADEIPASLDFREAIRKDKLPITFASKKSLFNDVTADKSIENSAPPPKRKSMRIESKVADAPTTTTTKRARLSCPNRIQTTTDQTSTESSLPPPQSTTKVNGRRKSVIEDVNGRASKATTAYESESQNLFVPKTQSVSTPLSSSSTSAAESRSTRRKSLKSKSSTVVPARSPINTRKRKSIGGTTSDSAPKKSLSAFEIDDSCSETDERCVKKERCEKSNAEESGADSSENSSSASSVVTVIAADSGASQMSDSVMIIEEEAQQQIIIIDSESPVSDSKDAIESSTEVVTEVTIAANGDAKTTEEEDAVVVENTQVESGHVVEDRTESVEDHDRSANESVKSTSSSFNLALSESLRVNGDDEKRPPEVSTSDEENIVSSQSENVAENGSASNGKAADETVAEKGTSAKVAASSAPENAVSTSEDVSSDVSASPLNGNSRTLQMLQMVFNNNSSSLSVPKTRFKSNTRSPSVSTSPASGRVTANGMGARTAVNSRPMKMLAANGLVDNIARSSPNKILNFADKIEKFRYVPKECTSPSILKKPNLNGTISPKSPKSVNFAERLTDTREYHIDDETNNMTDSWSSVGSQGDNLMSDDEATSQETLYPCLHNCADDIKNITERLTMNQQQLDTLKRMGIETVGQLASASTIVGKSIPVGDNRIQRLRNALKAYDNERKLKGLRAPSVRRKITYKSPIEVASIIEIMDDERAAQSEVETINAADYGIIEKLNDAVELKPKVTLKKLSSSNLAVYRSGSPPDESSSPVGETQRCSSPVGQTQQCSSPAKSTRSQVSSPAKNETAAADLALIRVLKSLPNLSSSSSPSTKGTESAASPSSCSKVAKPSSPRKAATGSPPKVASAQPTDSLCANKILQAVDDRPSSSPASKTASTSVRGSNDADQFDVRVTLTPINESASAVRTEKNEVVVAESATEIEETVEKVESRAVKRPANKDGDFWRCTQDDEQDFVCTNHEESVFANGDRRTYSKCAKTTTASTIDWKPKEEVVAAAAASAVASKSLSSVVIGVEANVSPLLTASANECKEDGAEETSFAEEQQSISIFSSEAAKSGAEDAIDVSIFSSESTNSGVEEEVTNETSLATSPREVEKDAAALDVAVVEDEDVASSSSDGGGRIELTTRQDEDTTVSKTSSGTESVFGAVLRGILEPYVGPACLSRWSEEAASRAELHKIVRSVIEGAERLRGADSMDVETKNILRRLRDVTDGE